MADWAQLKADWVQLKADGVQLTADWVQLKVALEIVNNKFRSTVDTPH